MSTSRIDLSHEEMWDDSVLIDSWNQALDEYKKYHSVFAKGGSLEDLEAEEAKASQARNAEDPERDTDDQPSGADQLGTQQRQQRSDVDTTDDKHHDEDAFGDTSMGNAGDTANGNGNAAPAAPPQVLLGTVRDEGLKKLLMSWYYAGYYTGLYEGQQQQRNVQESQERHQ